MKNFLHTYLEDIKNNKISNENLTKIRASINDTAKRKLSIIHELIEQTQKNSLELAQKAKRSGESKSEVVENLTNSMERVIKAGEIRLQGFGKRARLMKILNVPVTKSIEYLINNGVKVDAVDSQENTMLTYAIEYGGYSGVKQLIETYKASLTPEGRFNSPLVSATVRGKTDVLEMWFRQGNKIEEEYVYEPVLLQLISHFVLYTPEQVKMLLDHGAKKDATIQPIYQKNIRGKTILTNPDKAGLTALHLAAYYDKEKVIEILVEKGANIDATIQPIYEDLKGKKFLMNPDTAGLTALHLAAYYGKVKVIETLVEKGANINATIQSIYEDLKGKKFLMNYKNAGRTPLHIAILSHKKDAEKKLKELGAKSDIVDARGYTASQFKKREFRAQNMDEEYLLETAREEEEEEEA